MNFHAIMPYYRKHLFEKLISSFLPMNLIWHPICDSVDIEQFTPEVLEKYSWIKPLLVPPLKIPGDLCYRKNNDFIEAGDIIDDDYYGFIHDDDMYVDGFIEKIKQQTAKIIFYSADRGDTTPPDSGPMFWPPIPLIINSLEDVQIAKIDMCQYIMKGEILRQTRMGNHDLCDDGHYAIMLRTRWKDDCIVLPEIGIKFNYFQPGRYIGR